MISSRREVPIETVMIAVSLSRNRSPVVTAILRSDERRRLRLRQKPPKTELLSNLTTFCTKRETMRRLWIIAALSVLPLFALSGCDDKQVDAVEESIDAQADSTEQSIDEWADNLGDSLDKEADQLEESIDAKGDDLDAKADALEAQLEKEFD